MYCFRGGEAAGRSSDPLNEKRSQDLVPGLTERPSRAQILAHPFDGHLPAIDDECAGGGVSAGAPPASAGDAGGDPGSDEGAAAGARLRSAELEVAVLRAEVAALRALAVPAGAGALVRALRGEGPAGDGGGGGGGGASVV